MRYIVTTSKPNLEPTAAKISSELGIPMYHRQALSLEKMSLEYQAEAIIVVETDRVVLWHQGRILYFHPGLAKLRLIELRKGHQDQMVTAMDLKPGDTVLDCTLGMATDALVAASVVGKEGTVTGLEFNPVIAKIVELGLKHSKREAPLMQQAMGRISVIPADYREYLSACEQNSFDVVYFDPMFRLPLNHSSTLNSLRPFAHPEAIDPDAIKLALSVARKRIVIKERQKNRQFEKLGVEKVLGGKSSSVAYGIIYK